MKPLETDRLIIRTFQLTDWPAVFDYMCEPSVAQWMPEEPYSESEAERFVRGAIPYTRQSECPEKFALVLKPHDTVIGHLIFDHYFGMVRTRELGWVIHPSYQRNGYATEAARALVRYGFETLLLHRLVATCDMRNGASCRVMEKLGMRREASFISCIYRKGEWIDEYIYAILEDEWQAQRAYPERKNGVVTVKSTNGSL